MPKSSNTQKHYYLMVLLPMWRGQLDLLTVAEREYRKHLFAIECLRRAKGPVADSLRLADFCQKWEVPQTLRDIGPAALLKKIIKTGGGSAIFDPTEAINIGFKVVVQMGPLLSKVQIEYAYLHAIDDKVVSKGVQDSVLEILQLSGTSQNLVNKANEMRIKVIRVWKETVALAEKMEPIRQELGLPEMIKGADSLIYGVARGKSLI